MIVYVPISDDDKITLDKNEFERLIEQAKQEGYNQGFKDGNNNITYSNPYYPTVIYQTTAVPWWMEHKYEITC